MAGLASSKEERKPSRSSHPPAGRGGSGHGATKAGAPRARGRPAGQPGYHLRHRHRHPHHTVEPCRARKPPWASVPSATARAPPCRARALDHPACRSFLDVRAGAGSEVGWPGAACALSRVARPRGQAAAAEPAGRARCGLKKRQGVAWRGVPLRMLRSHRRRCGGFACSSACPAC
jgi:hypothetical protein